MSYPYLGDLIKDLTGINLPLPLPMFGLMVAAAFLTAIWVSRLEVQRLYEMGRIGLITRKTKNKDGQYVETSVLPSEIVSDLGIVTLIAGLLGARIFHLMEHPHEFITDPLPMIFSRGGFTIFGGLIIGTLAGVYFVKKNGLPIPALCDAVAPAMMLGYAIGRIGCQISGDGDWGIAADLALKPDWLPSWFWAQTYDNNIVGELIASPGVYPTPVYEILMGLFGFVILWAFRKHPFRPGWLFALYLFLCGLERFSIEQIRINPVTTFFGIHATQAEIISVALMFLGILGMTKLSRLSNTSRSS
ncbi:MAG: prolipoprotein diacylglyceryl transferase [Sideroxydans sp.]|jgi:phosphatidylglycerol:prolipoprotein diacylglycerol transferase|nr:prolipoprotein diacylglyceryl transferase [Sideroxydans sp.]